MVPTRIHLYNAGYLDITEDVQVPLNFSIAEIQDISSRQGSFSKTILLPGTHNNNLLLGNIFDVNIINSTFNQNLRQPCSILQDNIPVFEGYLQLLNIIKLNPTQINPDEQIIYEVAVKDSVGDFYSTLSDKLLTDLDSTFFNQYNHIYNISNVTSTFFNDVNDVYKYHNFISSISSTRAIYALDDFKPSIFAKVYFDRIFNEAGYSYQWDSLEECFFDKLIIPYNGKIPEADVKQYQFKAGATSTTSYLFPRNLNFNTDVIVYPNDSTNNYFDNGNNYNTSTGAFISNFNGSATFKTRYKINIYFDSPTNAEFRSLGPGFNLPSLLKVYLRHHIGKLSNPIINYEYPLTNDGLIFDFNFQERAAGDPVESLFFPVGIIPITGLTLEFQGSGGLLIGDEVMNWISGVFEATGGKWYFSGLTTELPPNFIPKLGFDINVDLGSDNNYFLNEPVATFGEGMEIVLSEFVPKQQKQKDFISSIIKMYNLYITKDEQDEKKLILRTRDEFYDGGKTLDWTSKLRIDDNIKVQFLPDVQNKKVLFTHKLGNSVFDKDYNEKTNEIYGQLEYTFENEFVDGVKKIETSFASTPIVDSKVFLPVAAINGRNPEGPLRILYDSGVFDLSAFGQVWYYRGSNSFITPYTNISIATHLDNPVNPTFDINFGLFDYATYQNYNLVTNNNLFNRYYSRYMQQIESGKLMTCTLRLNNADIYKLDFRDKIFISDAYWFINKIIDYNPNGNGLTQVELISVEDALSFVPVQTTKNNSSVRPINSNIDGLLNADSIIHKNDYNIIAGPSDNNNVIGSYNVIQPGSVNNLILGSDNNVAGEKNFVMGDNSFVSGNKNVVLGAGNVRINGDNLTVVTNTFTQYANAIDAGRNLVLNQFSVSKPIAIISGGRNLVRGFDSGTLESAVNGGRNSVL